jgi:pilus assembly protein Flp/PilA
MVSASGEDATAFVQVLNKGIPMKILRKLIGDNKGATAIEYGLIAALIAVAMITALRSVGSGVTNSFTTVAGNMNG